MTIASTSAAARAARHETAPWRLVVCAIEADLASLEVARQATALSDGGRLEVAAAAGVGPTGTAYVDAARVIAAREGVVTVVRHVRGADTIPAVLRLAGTDGLLVVGVGRAREPLGELAYTAVLGAASCVLVARQPDPCGAVTDRIAVVVNSDSDRSEGTVLARALARMRGAAFVGAIDGGVCRSSDDIIGVARRLDASLVVVDAPAWRHADAAARRSLAVAARAHCSVLVARNADR